MIKISAFKAIKQAKMESGEIREDLKSILEPNSLNSHPLMFYRNRFEDLMHDESLYVDNEPAIYVYEHTEGDKSSRGVWAITEIDEKVLSKINEHEQTIADHAEKIKLYKDCVGIEGEPIILTYPPQKQINELLDLVTNDHQPEIYQQGDVSHRLWKVKNTVLIKTFERAFDSIPKLYVADGHHRLAASVTGQSKGAQLISTVYFSTDQLIIKEFNRLIIPVEQIDTNQLLGLINHLFEVSIIPGNLPYRPVNVHQMGMCLNGIWYQLNLKTNHHHLQDEADAVILQEHILKVYFKIYDPGEDKRLQNFDPVKGWSQLLDAITNTPHSLAFTLFPITAEQFIDYADEGVFLPPKSTWIEPKLPYGLMIYNSLLPDRCV